VIEKALTTPEQYPPVDELGRARATRRGNPPSGVEWTEAEVHVGMQGLVMKHLAGRSMQAGSRVDRYKHARRGLALDDANPRRARDC